MNREISALPCGKLVVAITLLHLAFAGFPSVNLEYAFADAAGYFSIGEGWRISQYFSVQANTLGLPYAIALASRLVPWDIQALTVARLLVVAGIPLLALALARISRFLGRQDSDGVLLYTLLNPLVWIYAGRATADFLPVAIGLFSISLVLERDSTWRSLAAGLAFALACLLKYHAVFLLLPLLALRGLRGPNSLPKAKLALFLAPLALLMPGYLILVHQSFGFWVTPPEFQVKHRFSLLGLLSNFVCYAGFLTLLAWPTLILLPQLRAAIWHRRGLVLAMLLALPAAGAFLVSDNGEMNFGPMDRWIAPEGRTALFALFAAGLALPLIPMGGNEQWKGRERARLWLAAVALLLILSFTRPAQRYLLFVIPFVVLAMPPAFFTNRRLFHATLLLFCTANAFVDISRWCTGTAAQRMVVEVQSRVLIESTDPGAILSHAGGPFHRASHGQSAYTIVAGPVPDAVVTTQAGVSIFRKSYSLVRQPSPTALPPGN